MSFAPLADDEPTSFRICFVCTGNICRSVMAEVVFGELITRAGYPHLVQTSSAGTGDWHVGERADSRTLTALSKRNYDAAAHRARQFELSWFDDLDLIVALDRSHERILKNWAPSEIDRSKVQLLLAFDGDPAQGADVPDPYYSDAAMFDTVLEMVERSSQALFAQLEPAIRHGGFGALRTETQRPSDPAAREKGTPS